MEGLKRFDFDPLFDIVVAPKKVGTSVTIGKEKISLSLIDYLDIDLSTGKVCVRNRFTGTVMIMSPKGELLQFNAKQLKMFIDNIDERFYKTSKKWNY